MRKRKGKRPGDPMKYQAIFAFAERGARKEFPHWFEGNPDQVMPGVSKKPTLVHDETVVEDNGVAVSIKHYETFKTFMEQCKAVIDVFSTPVSDSKIFIVPPELSEKEKEILGLGPTLVDVLKDDTPEKEGSWEIGQFGDDSSWWV